MHHLRRRAFLRYLAVAAAGAYAGRALAAASRPPQPVKVGVLLDFTGPLGEFGPHHRNAIELAARQLNDAAREVLGGPIVQMVYEDASTTPSIGVDRARKLVEVDRVPVLIGALATGVTVPVAESVTIPSGVLQITQSGSSPLLSVLPADRDKDLLFRTVASDALQAVVAAQLAAGELVKGYHLGKAAVIYVNNPYGQGLADVFARAFERRGGRVTASVAVPEEPRPTYTAELRAALRGQPDVLVAATYPGQATVYLREAVDVFGFKRFQFTDGTKSLEIVKALGAELVEGQLGTTPASDPQWEGWRTFAAAYEKAYGAAPNLPYMDTAYDATAVAGLAIARCLMDGVPVTGVNVRDRLRLVSNPPGQKVGVGDFRRALELIKSRQDVDYTGAAGEVDFDESGDVITPVEIWRYSGGAIQTVMIRRPNEIPRQ
ncbi:MAG: ABC transporter substrate-binding protein [Limnochordaceae bacterium]|nr:ABC transporter substrate-binding protein [Limnochordaceae bacterium]